MLDLALKDISAHKLRTFLTVLGVIIAIGAIVSLGSISAGMNDLVQSQLKLASGLVILNEEGMTMGQGPPTGRMAIEDLDKIREMSGVEEISPLLIHQSGMTMIGGIERDRMETIGMEQIEIEDGRWMESGEYAAVLGDYVYENSELDIGDVIVVEDTDLIIVGKLELMSTMMDYVTITNLEVLQDILEEDEYVTMAHLKPEDLEDVDILVEEIESEFPAISAQSSQDAVEQAEKSINTVRLITLGIGFISSIVAAIGIINTMFMSITERKRQIGIMKAQGATQRQVIIDVLEQGLLFAIIGGGIGLLIGYGGTYGLNMMMGMPIAKVTWQLASFGFGFGIVLTLAAAIYPAIVASRIDPIEAIRSG